MIFKFKKHLILMNTLIALGIPLYGIQASIAETSSVQNSISQNVHEFKLKNGLTLIVKEDHRSPVVVSQIWYKIGSIDEHYGKTGLSHFLEHMMFSDTKNYKNFSKTIAKIGGRDNAYTTADYTVYFEQLHKDQLELALKLEADRMINVVFDDKKIKTELNVVKEERRLRTEDNPNSLLHESFMNIAYPTIPYRNPIIGWMQDLDNMKLEDAKTWYETWYSPNNATVIIVGDVNPQNVYQLVQKYFNEIQPKQLPYRLERFDEIPRIAGRREITIKARAKNPTIIMGFPVPVLKDLNHDKEPYALEVLIDILDGHRSARLPKHLIQEQQVANTLDTSYDSLSRGDGLFTFSGTPRENKNISDIEKSVLNELNLIKTKGVSQAELDRVKSQLIARKVFEKDSMFYQAMQIGQFHLLGFDYRQDKLMTEKLKAITSKDIQDVVKKYFVEDKMIVGILKPELTSAVKDNSKSIQMNQAGEKHHGVH